MKIIKWLEFFEKQETENLIQWSEGLGKLPLVIYTEFEGLSNIDDMIKHEIKRRTK